MEEYQDATQSQPEFELNHFKTEKEAKDFLEKDLGFAECVRFCLIGDGIYGRTFIDQFMSVTETLGKNTKINHENRTVEVDLKDKVGLAMVNIIYEFCWLRLNEDIRTNIQDTEIARKFCTGLYNADKNKNFLFGLEFMVNVPKVGGGNTSRILINKGFKIQKLFETLEGILDKKCVFKVKRITVFNGDSEKDWKIVQVNTQEEAQKFIDMYGIS